MLPRPTKRKTAARRRAEVEFNDLAFTISNGEQAALKVFCRYLMTPGYMLCFNGDDHDTHGKSLGRLVGRGLLRSERFPGGYSLTSKGYQAMRGAE